MMWRNQRITAVRDRACLCLQGLLICTIAFLSGGCGTMPNSYVPATVGPIDNPQPGGPIEVRISTSQDNAFVGDNLYFSVIIRNRGDEPVWIPRNPDVLLSWVYPNGQRDSFMREFPPEQYFSDADAILLKPGQQMTRTVVVKTYFFPKPGITEFRALVHASRNTNPGLHPFWHGQTESNSFGVMVKNPKKKVLRGEQISGMAAPPPPSS